MHVDEVDTDVSLIFHFIWKTQRKTYLPTYATNVV